MFTRILAISALLCFQMQHSGSSPVVVSARARQFLPTLPGYIPVYIRPGDTPLEEINPDLAEAFQSFDALRHARLGLTRPVATVKELKKKEPVQMGGQIQVFVQPLKPGLGDETVEEENDNAVTPSTRKLYQHIQKISRS